MAGDCSAIWSYAVAIAEITAKARKHMQGQQTMSRNPPSQIIASVPLLILMAASLCLVSGFPSSLISLCASVQCNEIPLIATYNLKKKVRF